jgi:HPt (histidine-containing phosphotransfer) domain-containing protein/CheY-like chemotaxis protein
MATVGHLRVLLIENDPGRSERITSLLEGAQHAVLPLSGLEEAVEALEIQRFDAVLIPSGAPDRELQAFTAKLRQLEQSGRSDTRIPVLSVSAEVPNNAGWLETHETNIDGYLPERFEPSVFTQAVEALAGSVARADTKLQSPAWVDLPRFDLLGFQEQMMHDRELEVEIINLFLGECVDQVSEMQQALADGDWLLLSRVTHTLKGSLGSLHALRSRACAQELELAAKHGEGERCGPLLDQLTQELAALRPELIQLRDA